MIKSHKKSILFIIVIIIVIALFWWAFLSKSNLSEYKINLIGDKYIILYQNEEYIEPGYSALENNKPATDKVIVTNEIKNTPGVYRILYQLGNVYEYRYVEIKELVDSKLDINVVVNSVEITNKDVVVDINVVGETFYSITLPNGNVIYNNITSYTINENGIYKFEARNQNNEVFSKEININNIDKIDPTGTCVGTLNNNNTIIEVSTSENDLTYYYYDGTKLLTSLQDNNYLSNSKTSENIKVILEDKASNRKEISCKIIDKRFYEQVKPSTTDKIVYHGDSDTLKTYIVDKGSYFLTYFWTKDAYSQFNKFDSPDYGRILYYPKDLLVKAKTANNLDNKIIVGFNASGFYLKGTFDAYSVERNRAYDKTSVGTLVITNGKVVRNAYQYAVKTWYMVGINKDNKLLVFEDKESNNIEEKKGFSQTVINSGIRNTFTFAAPLIENGKRTNNTTSMAGGFEKKMKLQIFCQINENNYVLYTSTNNTRNKAIEEFLNLGCKTAMNFDGGGSIALFYKDKNSNEFVKVVGGGRELSEVGYFTE